MSGETQQQTRKPAIEPGTAQVGMRVLCPEGLGSVHAILSPDVVMIELDGKAGSGKSIFAKFDLSEVASIEPSQNRNGQWETPPPTPEQAVA